VPAALLGLRGPARTVTATRTFQAQGHLLVDPHTGAVVRED
jgi:hypothetical protein